MKKNLIVNADDCGLTSAVTRGIFDAMVEGVVTDFSLMATGEAFEETIQLMKQKNKKSCGVHLTFIDNEKPLTGPNPYLTDGDKFYINRNQFLVQFMKHRSKILPALKNELKAQIEKVLSTGIQVSHLDSHQHLHIFPSLANLMIELCNEYKVPFVRIPHADMKSPIAWAVNAFAHRLKKLAKKNKIRHVQFMGFQSSGKLSPTFVDSYVQKASMGNNDTFELMVHPGYEDDYTRQKYSHWGYSWQREMDSLKSLSNMALDSQGVVLTDFAALA